MRSFENGRHQAEVLIARTPAEVGYWLERARRGRRRLTTRLFNPRKKQYLEGFISALEAYHAGSVEAGRGESDSAPSARA